VAVLMPNGHRVKVVTNPNMSLLALKETACAKKNWDPQTVALEYKGRRVDLSSTVRFSGIPNNGTLELVELGEEERMKAVQEEEVSVCLQVPSGERLTGSFPPSTSLGEVVAKWGDQAGKSGPGEVPVVVYTRMEIVGQEKLDTTSLRTLGLVKGKVLMRFFYKQPEILKGQAGVYDIKMADKEPTPERPHLPMRREAATLPKEEVKEMEVDVEKDKFEAVTEETMEESVVSSAQSSTELVTDTNRSSPSLLPDSQPDSTSVPPVIRPVPPHGAIVFREDDGGNLAFNSDIGDDFFDLSIAEVKSLYKKLKDDVKKLEEGEPLMTKEMKESQQEGEKLRIIHKYKTGVVRIRLPCRHIVQGEFAPSTTISSVLTWLSPLLLSPSPSSHLYTAPPRTTLPPDSSLLDLGLFPAALLHYSTSEPGPQHLTDQALESLSNSVGAQQVATESRRQSVRHSRGGQIGSSGGSDSRPGKRSLGFQTGEAGTSGSGSSSQSTSSGQKVPKWFKPGK